MTGCKGGQTSAPLKEFRVEIRTAESDKTVSAADAASTQLDIKNPGSQTWPVKGTYAVHVSYHLLDSDKRVISHDGVRTVSPTEIRPGETTRIAANFNAPPNPGNYILRFTLAQELVNWFDAVSPSNAIDLPIKVVPK